MSKRIAALRSRAAAVLRWLAAVNPRDAVILIALALVWFGLWNIYRPLAPIGVGGFLLWFTTIRRVPE